jgi:UDP-4-amino-4,6-dideoxy-N-acetyl-beta-L-altrosamine transaminase
MGGSMKMIPYGNHTISQDDINAVVEVLQSSNLTQGPRPLKFEELTAAYCGAQFAISANSATSCLHIACLALGLGKGDLLWTSTNTFVASANCARYCGADVDLVDIDPQTYNMSVDALEEKLIRAKREGRLPKIVVPVHFAGLSCDMKRIKKLSEEYGFFIIEDASHAVGAKYLGQPVGSCQYSDIAVFSFHPVKIITSGEGGMCLTNNQLWAEKMKLFKNHGINRTPELLMKGIEGAWYFEQIELGYNFRMTDIHAALGISQLKRLDEFVTKRRKIADWYGENLKDFSLTRPVESDGCYSSYHLYVVQLEIEELKRKFIDIFSMMRAQGVEVGKHYIPIYMHPYYRDLGLKAENFPNTVRYYQRSLTLPIYPDLSVEDLKTVLKVLRSVLS